MTELVTLRDPSNMSQQLITPCLDEQQSPELIGLLIRFKLRRYLLKLKSKHIYDIGDLLDILGWSDEHQNIFVKEIFETGEGTDLISKNKFIQMVSYLSSTNDTFTMNMIKYIKGECDPPRDSKGRTFYSLEDISKTKDGDRTILKIWYAIIATSPIVFKMKTELIQTNNTKFVFSKDWIPINLTITQMLDSNPFTSNIEYDLYIDSDKSKTVGNVEYVSSNEDKHEFKIIKFEIDKFHPNDYACRGNDFCKEEHLNDREVWIKLKTSDFMEKLIDTMEVRNLNTNYGVFQEEFDSKNRKDWIEKYNPFTQKTTVVGVVGLAAGIANTAIIGESALQATTHGSALVAIGHIASATISTIGIGLVVGASVEAYNQLDLYNKKEVTGKKACKNIATTATVSGFSSLVGWGSASIITGYVLPLIATATGPVGALVYFSSFAIGYYGAQQLNMTERLSKALDKWIPEDTSEITKKKAVKEVTNDAFRVLGFTGSDDKQFKYEKPDGSVIDKTKHEIYKMVKDAYRIKIIKTHPDRNKAFDANNTSSILIFSFNYIKEKYRDPTIVDNQTLSESSENGQYIVGVAESEGGSDETSKLINIEYLLKECSVNREQIKEFLSTIVDITTSNIEHNHISIKQNRSVTINNIGFVLTGNVGTGKTATAMNVSKILYTLKLISKDIVKIVTSPYTLEDIDDNMKEASGGVIIFDNFDPSNLNSKCITRLTTPNTNGSISVLIFITKENINWSKMVWANEDWKTAANKIKEMIKHTDNLKEYSRDDIKNHFIAHLKNEGYFFEKNDSIAYLHLQDVFKMIITDRHMKIISNHYNGNFINKIFENCCKFFAKRIASDNSVNDITSLHTFTREDVKAATISLMRQLVTKYPPGSEDFFEIPL